MSKFINVDEAPTDLRKGEFVVSMPTFVEEITASKLRVIPQGIDGVLLTRNNALRNVLVLIGMNYQPGMFNAYEIPMGQYEGLEYHNMEELSAIVLKIINKHAPALIDAAIEQKIKDRPFDTRLIYFVGPFSKTGVFTKNGLGLIKTSEIDDALGVKVKKEMQKKIVTKNDNLV